MDARRRTAVSQHRAARNPRKGFLEASEKRAVSPKAEKGDDESESGEESAAGCRRPKQLKETAEPTEKEVGEHNLTHLPFRTWCAHCIRGKAKNPPHWRQKESEGEKRIPAISADYCFLGSEEDESQAPVWVMTDHETKAVFAYVCESKGSESKGLVDQVVEDINKLGHTKVILKTDQEPAIRDVQRAVRDKRRQATILENSPVGESQSNGRVERCIQTVVAQVRTMKDALEKRYCQEVDSRSPILHWLVRHAASLITRYHVGKDGRTPYERWKGKQRRKELAEFGECVHFRPSTATKKPTKT